MKTHLRGCGSFSTALGEDVASILNTFPHPIIVLNSDDSITYANPGAEHFFAKGVHQLSRSSLGQLIPRDSPVFGLVKEARQKAIIISEYGVELSSSPLGLHLVDATAAPMVEAPGKILLTLRNNGIAAKMNRQLVYRGAARSVTGMAAMLAHEVKNPLSGIRGAAQLLEQNADAGDQVLTRLICDETDRIVKIIERMEMFFENPSKRIPINIHRVLERVRQIAQSGFGKHIEFIEDYDPSLPLVYGNFDQLVQVVLNLVKNAVEAVPLKNGQVTLSTAFQHGLRLTILGGHSKVNLPIEICVQDNGSGVAEDIKPFLFDAFVTNKAQGSGLGLALVAKVVDEHGGVVECVDEGKGTKFRIMLPVVDHGVEKVNP